MWSSQWPVLMFRVCKLSRAPLEEEGGHAGGMRRFRDTRHGARGNRFQAPVFRESFGCSFAQLLIHRVVVEVCNQESRCKSLVLAATLNLGVSRIVTIESECDCHGNNDTMAWANALPGMVE